MKKRVPVLLLCLLILPLTLLFGCGDTVSYSVYAFTSSSTYGSVSGTGSYTEGDSVSLSATAKNGSHVIGWVKDNTTLISNDGTYSISNTTASDSEEVSKSVLTFASSSANQGSYTAVFSESKVMYAKLSSIYFCTDQSVEPAENSTENSLLTVSSMTVSQGTVDLATLFSLESLAASDGGLLATNEISSNSSVIKLSTSTTQYVRLNLVLTSGETSSIFTMRAGLNFQTSTSKDSNGNYIEVEGSKFTYHVEFSDGEYKIVYSFDLNGKSLFLIVTYATLS